MTFQLHIQFDSFWTFIICIYFSISNIMKFSILDIEYFVNVFFKVVLQTLILCSQQITYCFQIHLSSNFTISLSTHPFYAFHATQQKFVLNTIHTQYFLIAVSNDVILLVKYIYRLGAATTCDSFRRRSIYCCLTSRTIFVDCWRSLRNRCLHHFTRYSRGRFWFLLHFLPDVFF